MGVLNKFANWLGDVTKPKITLASPDVVKLVEQQTRITDIILGKMDEAVKSQQSQTEIFSLIIASLALEAGGMLCVSNDFMDIIKQGNYSMHFEETPEGYIYTVEPNEDEAEGFEGGPNT